LITAGYHTLGIQIVTQATTRRSSSRLATLFHTHGINEVSPDEQHLAVTVKRLASMGTADDLVQSVLSAVRFHPQRACN
jgi:hypothetical protein